MLSDNLLLFLVATQTNLISTYFLPLVGPAIVVFTFYLNDKKDRKNKRKEAKRAWYFKAYFEPALVKVEIFFNESALAVEVAIAELNKDFDEKASEKRIGEVGIFLGTLALKKRKFIIEVVDMFKFEYPKEAIEVEKILMDFEDAGAGIFGKLESIIEPGKLYDYISVITEQKAKMIQTLSHPALLIKKAKKKSPNSVVISAGNDMI